MKPNWNQRHREVIEKALPGNARDLALGAYEIGRCFYALDVSVRRYPSAVHWMRELGCLLWYALDNYKYVKANSWYAKVVPMKLNEMVPKWKDLVVELVKAHSKDEADRAEASVEDLLTPLLSAPVSQLRNFARLLLEALKNDPGVPFLVWRAYEIWAEQMEVAPEAEIRELKRDLARRIVDMVEQDAKEQIGEAMVRALMWRSPEKLEEVAEVITEEKSAGRKVRIKGRESCLFIEAGGSEDSPHVCVQI